MRVECVIGECGVKLVRMEYVIGEVVVKLVRVGCDWCG